MYLSIYLSIELHVTTHSYIPHPVWSVLLCCPRLACLELTACEGMWDAALASLLQDNPGSLANISRWHHNDNDNDNDTMTMTKTMTLCTMNYDRLCIRGSHRGDISLTERSVALLRRRCPRLTQVSCDWSAGHNTHL